MQSLQHSYPLLGSKECVEMSAERQHRMICNSLQKVLQSDHACSDEFLIKSVQSL